MAERLYIRNPFDQPHGQSTVQPARTRCGHVLIGMVSITEAQAKVFLGDQRCAGCFPGWSARKGQTTHG